MTTPIAAAAEGPLLDFKRLSHSTFGLRVGLVVLTWLGLLLTLFYSSGTSAMVLPFAFLAMPVWGFIFGGRGVSKARNKAVKVTGTQILPDDHWVTQETARLSARIGLKVRPWVATMPVNNAYAIGSRPDHALVVIGTPLLQTLKREEVCAIIGHELGHIANNDMRRMVLAEQFQKSLTWYLSWSDHVQRFGRWALNLFAELWVLALSRKREFWADAIGAAVTSPAAMRMALIKIHQHDDPLSSYERANARLMFRGKETAFFSTHPTLEQRVAAIDKASYVKRLPMLARRPGAATGSLPASQPVETLPAASQVAWAKKDKP